MTRAPSVPPRTYPISDEQRQVTDAWYRYLATERAFATNINSGVLEARTIAEQAQADALSATAIAEGAANNKPVILTLDTNSVVLPADSSGNILSFATAFGQAKVFEGGADVTVSATLSVTATNCSGTINSSADVPVSGQVKGYYRVTAMTAATAALTVTATYNSKTVTQVFTLAKAVAGVAGANGANGTNGVVVSLTKPSITLFAYAEGTVPSYANANGLATVFDGGTNVSSSSTFSVSASGCTGTVNTSANTPVNGQPAGYYQVTDMSADSASLIITIVYNSVTYSRIFTLSKVKTGYEIVGALPSTNLFAGRMVFLTTDNKLYRYTGSAWTTAVPAVDISGQLTDAQLAGLAASKVTGTLSNSQIADLAATKITGTITETQIANDAVTSAKIFAGAVTTAKLSANAVTANEIAANAITTAKIEAGAITTAKIAAGSVTATEIAASAVTAGKIAANAVTTTELAASAITTDKVAAGAITAAKMSVTSLSSMTATIGTLRTATSGARVEIKDNIIEVYDASRLRVRMGIW